MNARSTGRVAVVGDLAGHVDELRGELVRLGAQGESLPDDLTVIQVGDLVHRGPDSDGMISLVDLYLTNQPEQWVQLVGNHEAQYLREPSFDWPERIGEEAVDTIRRWWATGRMRAAASVRVADERFLVTHAGLTEGFWRRALDSPGEAWRAAASINSFIGRHDEVLFSAGQMLGGGDADLSAGPVWAATASELVPSWLRTVLPFSQIHGHSTIVDWKRGKLRCPKDIANLVTIDKAAAHETVTLDGGRIIGVDPGHGRRPHRRWRAWVLADATVEV